MHFAALDRVRLQRDRSCGRVFARLVCVVLLVGEHSPCRRLGGSNVWFVQRQVMAVCGASSALLAAVHLVSFTSPRGWNPPARVPAHILAAHGSYNTLHASFPQSNHAQDKQCSCGVYLDKQIPAPKHVKWSFRCRCCPRYAAILHGWKAISGKLKPEPYPVTEHD